MANGDMSNCFAASTGFGSFNRFNSGRIGVNWDNTGGGTEKVIVKDGSDDSDFTKSTFYLEYLQMACASGKVVLYDGSAGLQIAGIAVSDGSAGSTSQAWDFKDDPLKVLESESTSSLCISAGNGQTTGFVKGYWG